jgi:ATP-dependent DNA helicase RecG
MDNVLTYQGDYNVAEMTPKKIKELVKQGEGIEVEFKTSRFELPKNAFESICAFLNRRGGHLLLGVNNKGEVEGVMNDAVQLVMNAIISNANNLQKLNPTFYLSPEVISLEGKKVINVYVPESSQVHSTNGKIFDRNEDGDFEITRQPAQVTQLYLRKQTTYTENQVFPYSKLADFRTDLLKRVRKLAENERPGHPWMEMTDNELLRSAGLYKKDPVTGKAGYTLAAVLLLGKDETIMDALPHHKTDAILRIENLDRYDDRDDIRTNLIESYDRLMAFVAKHLPDKFFQENEHRSSLRDKLFREVVTNLLIHREFTNAFPAKLIIEGNRVLTENWNRPHQNGLIDPSNFSPFPKNPVIAKFFKEIGRVDELGSGVRNVFKYTGIYTEGAKPEFMEGDVFQTIIPIKAIRELTKTGDSDWQLVRSKVRNKFGVKFGVNSEKILELIFNEPSLSAQAVAKKIGISARAVEKHLSWFKKNAILERIGPDKTGYWEIKWKDNDSE